MKAITAPINVSSPREIIANLQVALQTSLGRGAILGNDPNARQAFSQHSDVNAKGRVYGRATARTLSIFQRERNDAMVILPDHLHVLWTSPVGDCDYPTRWMLMKTDSRGKYRRTTDAVKAGRRKVSEASGDGGIANNVSAMIGISRDMRTASVTTLSGMGMWNG